MSLPKPIPTIRRKLEIPVWLLVLAGILALSALAQAYTEFAK